MTNYWEEKQRQEAMEANYKLGKYGIKYCQNCGAPIEKYENIKTGLCEVCLGDL